MAFFQQETMKCQGMANISQKKMHQKQELSHFLQFSVYPSNPLICHKEIRRAWDQPLPNFTPFCSKLPLLFLFSLVFQFGHLLSHPLKPAHIPPISLSPFILPWDHHQRSCMLRSFYRAMKTHFPHGARSISTRPQACLRFHSLLLENEQIGNGNTDLRIFHHPFLGAAKE